MMILFVKLTKGITYIQKGFVLTVNIHLGCTIKEIQMAPQILEAIKL